MSRNYIYKYICRNHLPVRVAVKRIKHIRVASDFFCTMSLTWIMSHFDYIEAVFTREQKYNSWSENEFVFHNEEKHSYYDQRQ